MHKQTKENTSSVEVNIAIVQMNGEKCTVTNCNCHITQINRIN